MTTPKQKLTPAQKIQALLNLATSPNEAEATAAMEKAQELLAKYNLSMADVVKSSEKKFTIVKTKVTDVFAHKRRVGIAVGRVYFAKHYFEVVPTQSKSKNVYNRERHCFAGEQHNADIALMMFDYIIKTIDRLAKEEADKLEDKKKYWSFQTGFKTACAQRVYERLIEKLQTVTAPAKPGGNLPALANLYNTTQQEVTEFLESELGGLKSVKARPQNYDLDGMRAGRKAGDSIGLDAQITNGSNPAGLLE